MNDMLQRTLGTGQIAAMLSVAGIGWDQVADAAMLHGGTFNSVYRVALTDGSALILKAAPPPEVPVLRHEHGLLRAETLLYTLAAERRIASGTGRFETVAAVSGLRQGSGRWPVRWQ
jgi:hypothetical protein